MTTTNMPPAMAKTPPVPIASMDLVRKAKTLVAENAQPHQAQPNQPPRDDRQVNDRQLLIVARRIGVPGDIERTDDVRVHGQGDKKRDEDPRAHEARSLAERQEADQKRGGQRRRDQHERRRICPTPSVRPGAERIQKRKPSKILNGIATCHCHTVRSLA